MELQNFLVNAGFSTDYHNMVEIVDREEDLILVHHNEEGKNHPVCSAIRGYIYDIKENKVVVKGESDYKDVLLDDGLMEDLDPSTLCVGIQTTHVRLYLHNNQVKCSTNKKLNAFNSCWGIKGRSFGQMLLDTGFSLIDLYNENVYNDNGCIDLFIEAQDNQLVVNNDVGEVTKTKVYNRADLLSLNLIHRDRDYELSDDICWVDYRENIRYLSPSMWEKLYTIRNIKEPNILRRLFVLKGSSKKLLAIIPQDQREWLNKYEQTKTQLVEQLVRNNPPKEVAEIAKREKIPPFKAFFKLPGILQYKLLFEPNTM
jgi:hypothetical protein